MHVGFVCLKVISCTLHLHVCECVGNFENSPLQFALVSVPNVMLCPRLCPSRPILIPTKLRTRAAAAAASDLNLSFSVHALSPGSRVCVVFAILGAG